MSTGAEALIDQFKALRPDEQWTVYQTIAREFLPAEDYGPPSDEELTAAAAQTFALLDEEDERTGAR